MPVDYELVYKITPFIDRIRSTAGTVRDAQAKKAQADADFRQACATLSGKKVDELEFSNCACMANGIGFHVYAGNAPKGSGRNHCIFCGCDDCDFL